MNILIIEDDKDLQAFLKQALKDEGFVVDVAGDGLVGSQKARMHAYDLIILDITLPHKNGREVCKEIRSAGKHTPILMLSVESEVTKKIEFLDYGADDYMTKPFAFSELLARVRAILRRPEQFENPVLEVKNLLLDTLRHIVTFRGKIST